jgi:hypothetical protein
MKNQGRPNSSPEAGQVPQSPGVSPLDALGIGPSGRIWDDRGGFRAEQPRGRLGTRRYSEDGSREATWSTYCTMALHRKSGKCARVGFARQVAFSPRFSRSRGNCITDSGSYAELHTDSARSPP